ncbi:MAG TPA: flagellar hook-basal body complex protein FliE [Solirubrobacteraceae bacterium]|nr:flagellar hook-basal body complex protein FliE [Solirubrobacteraceae bacterium]
MIIPPLGGLGTQLSASQAPGLAQGVQGGASSPPGEASGVAGGEAGGFGGELTEAISSLEKTQDSASSASQALATGSVSDPESAVMTVEDAQLAMELAAQVRTKATEAVQTIFNTQV